jgi:hypothetical protein
MVRGLAFLTCVRRNLTVFAPSCSDTIDKFANSLVGPRLRALHQAIRPTILSSPAG